MWGSVTTRGVVGSFGADAKLSKCYVADQLHRRDPLQRMFRAWDRRQAPRAGAFPLVADPTQSIFKLYRAFDDFEQKPLHGTFLIDAEGKVRWQDISFEPFMDAAFLLEETKRLLALPSVL